MKVNRATQKYAQLKADLVARHTSLRRWALENGVPVGTVYLSARGLRNGPRARQIRKLINEQNSL
jgi:hypothetical protein